MGFSKSDIKALEKTPSNSDRKFTPPDDQLKAMFPDGMTVAEIMIYAPDDYEALGIIKAIE